MTPNKSRLRGWDLSGEIRGEKLISIPASDVQNGWMATHLVTKRCDLGLGLGFGLGLELGLGFGFRCSLFSQKNNFLEGFRHEMEGPWALGALP